MWTSIIAVVGTLAGASLAGVFQLVAAQSARSEERADQFRWESIDAVTELSAALTDHRRAMWQRQEAQLTGADVRESRSAVHESRSRIGAQATRVRLLITDQAVRDAADHATRATYAMRDAETTEDLEARRTAALAAHDVMVDAAGASLR